MSVACETLLLWMLHISTRSMSPSLLFPPRPPGNMSFRWAWTPAGPFLAGAPVTGSDSSNFSPTSLETNLIITNGFADALDVPLPVPPDLFTCTLHGAFVRSVKNLIKSSFLTSRVQPPRERCPVRVEQAAGRAPRRR